MCLFQMSQSAVYQQNDINVIICCPTSMSWWKEMQRHQKSICFFFRTKVGIMLMGGSISCVGWMLIVMVWLLGIQIACVLLRTVR